MSTREELLRRADVPDEQVDDIVAVAARLQDEARRESHGATVDEIAAVAAELDIEPRYVEQAIEKWRADRRLAQAAAVAKTVAAQIRGARLKRALVGALVGLIGLGALTAGVGVVGANKVTAARTQTVTAEKRLDVVVIRQAALAPQLLALSGVDSDVVAALQREVIQTPTTAARVRAASALSTAMATELGRLPPPANTGETQMRLNLQHEITGSQNRITTELRRYEEARTVWEQVATTGSGRVAVALGMAEAPG